MVLTMYEGREDQINWEKLPPETEDFPLDVQKAMVAYSKLSDRVVPDLGYLGKDFSLLDLLIKLEHVSDSSIFLETLLRIDAFFIKKSHDDIERARKRAKHG